jgi:hypothetical protein
MKKYLLGALYSEMALYMYPLYKATTPPVATTGFVRVLRSKK